MIIHNPILTGSLTLNNVNLSTGNLVTTGSNTFVGNQILSGSLTVSGSVSATGTLTAQTLVVQTVTSSVLYSSGSNVFGNNIANTQVMTGSVTVTGSLAVVTNGTEFQVNTTGVNLGNVLTDSHVISGSLRVNPNGLFVSGSGLVGIGTSSPSQLLEVSVTSQDDGVRITSSNSKPTLRFYSSFSNSSNRNWAISPNGQNFGDLQICTSAAQNGDPTASDRLTRLIITNTGNVGFGTSSPTGIGGGYTTLDIVGSNGGGFLFGRTSNKSFIYADNGGGYFGTETAVPLVFYTNTTEKMRITSGGTIVAGSTLAAPTGGEIGAWAWIPSQNRAYYSNSGGACAGFNRYTNTGDIIAFNYAGSGVGSISTNGSTVTFSGNALSDERFKENIQPIENALNTICKVEFKTFNYKESKQNSAGVTAQQLQTIEELSKFVIDGTNEESYKAVDYNAIIGYLGKAIQEQQAQIEELKSQINK